MVLLLQHSIYVYCMVYISQGSVGPVVYGKHVLKVMKQPQNIFVKLVRVRILLLLFFLFYNIAFENGVSLTLAEMVYSCFSSLAQNSVSPISLLRKGIKKIMTILMCTTQPWQPQPQHLSQR